MRKIKDIKKEYFSHKTELWLKIKYLQGKWVLNTFSYHF